MGRGGWCQSGRWGGGGGGWGGGGWGVAGGGGGGGGGGDLATLLPIYMQRSKNICTVDYDDHYDRNITK